MPKVYKNRYCAFVVNYNVPGDAVIRIYESFNVKSVYYTKLYVYSIYIYIYIYLLPYTPLNTYYQDVMYTYVIMPVGLPVSKRVDYSNTYAWE